MARRFRAELAILALCVGVAPAAAQFGNIFGGPPRPPADVPGRADPRSPVYPPYMQEPVTDPDEPDVPSQAAPGPGGPRPGPPVAIQSQPLPPPPGSAAAPDRPQPQLQPQPTLLPPPGAPNGPQPPGPPPAQRPPQAANAAPQPGDQVVTELPSQKIPNPKAVFSGLDKITGRITSFDVAINETVQFGALQVTPRVCYTRPPTEATFTDGFIEVDEVTLQAEVKRIFTGWMFAASPGLHGVEHPIYDVWLTDCKGAPTVAEAPPPPPAAAPPPRPARPATSAAAPRPRQPAPRPPQ